MKNKNLLLCVVVVILVVIFGYFIFIHQKLNEGFDLTDKEIHNAVYSDYNYPENFYWEGVNETGIYLQYEISNISHIPLCYEDKDIAFQLSKDRTSGRAAFYDFDKNIELVSQRETEKFFEFVWKIKTETNQELLYNSRIHKCNYFESSSNYYDNFEGIFNKRPINLQSSRELISYLWFIKNSNHLDKKIQPDNLQLKILDLISEDKGEVIQHTFYEANLRFGQDSNDTIVLTSTEYSANKQTGEMILVSKKELKTLEGEYRKREVMM